MEADKRGKEHHLLKEGTIRNHKPETMTPYELWQLEKYGNVIAEVDASEEDEAQVLTIEKL